MLQRICFWPNTGIPYLTCGNPFHPESAEKEKQSTTLSLKQSDDGSCRNWMHLYRLTERVLRNQMMMHVKNAKTVLNAVVASLRIHLFVAFLAYLTTILTL